MKFKKSVKLSLNKVTISDLGLNSLSEVRGGLADVNDPVAGTLNWTNCAACSIPICGTMVAAKSCAGPSCQGTCYQTQCGTCDSPPLACAAIDDIIADR